MSVIQLSQNLYSPDIDANIIFEKSLNMSDVIDFNKWKENKYVEKLIIGGNIYDRQFANQIR